MDLHRTIYVTYLEKEGPYIKIWGQTDRSLPIAIEKTLQQITPQFEQGLYMPVPANLHIGLMCCAKFKDGNYYRAKITNTSYVEQGMIEVLFIDYGNKDIISCGNIRTPVDSMQLLSIPPQARDFILAEVAMLVWDLSIFESIASELRYLELEIVPICEIPPYILIRLLLQKQDVTINLINRGLVIKVTVQSQQQALQQYLLQTVGRIQPQLPQPVAPAMIPVKMASPPLVTSSSTPTLLSYKAIPLENGTEHDVYVSYVSDGPCLFSVQLQKMEMSLKRLMSEINSFDLQPLDEYPLPGTVCLAQSSEDDYICRAVVTSMVDGEYKVFYVDFGNTELLQFDKLFQIPLKYVIPKVMATRFALAGLEAANISIEMKCTFKNFVNNKLLRMCVKPAATKSALPLCDLWDEHGIKAIDIIHQSALLSYPEPVLLPRGFSQDVKVSYVCSCNKFYVQLKSKETELANLMTILSETCPFRPLLDEDSLRQGSPCYALYTDGVWYRAQIVDFTQNIKVKYVDYGNEETVPIENLREPISDHIFMLRPQAIECSLNGYQNIEPDSQRDNLLEELIIEQEFNMKVVEMQPNRALVELFDSAHYNVASLLLDKVASATSQVSPLLIQDNHRIEHRKRSPPQSYREKRPLRELNERNAETNNWRQNSSSRYRNQQVDGQDLSDKETPLHSQRDESSNSFNARGGGVEKNLYHRGPKKFDGPRKRFDRSEEENGNIPGGEWKRDNTENRSFGRRERRNDDQNQDSFQQNRPDRVHRQPRGPDYQRDNEDRPKRFTRSTEFSRDDGAPKKFTRNHDFDRDDNQTKRFGRGQNFQRNDDEPRKFNRFEDKRSGDSYRNKRNEYKREPSEKSFSDASEKSWKRDHRPKDTDGKGRGKSFTRSPVGAETIILDDLANANDDWDDNSQPVIASSPPVTEEKITFAAATDVFKDMNNLLNQTETVSISWFYNPHYFYIQLEKYKKEFRSMMEEIQSRYKKRQTIIPSVNQPVIALFPEDKVLYRAVVLSTKLNRFQVRYVDYGNTATVDKIYEIETKYMELPAQAICCSLNGIIPPNEDWLDVDSYSSYFDKDTFSSTFISTFDTSVYYVDLTSEGNNISENLVAASLAFRPHSDFDINMLLGQQILVLLMHVESLSSIKIEIEPNLRVDAMMHNLATATETFEDNLKAWAGTFVIMYVDNVLDNKLEATFYDLAGQKLQIVVPDEDAYESVDPLSPLPIYTKTLNGFVSHATPTTIFLQPSRLEKITIQFLDAMFNHYGQATTDTEENLTPEIEGIYAVHSSDANWYRGKVTKICEENDGEVEVFYLDYGNTETVKVGELRFLADQFFQTSMLATEIKLDGGDCEKYNNCEIWVEVEYGDDGWVGKILDGNEESVVEVGENRLETDEVQLEPTAVDIQQQPGDAIQTSETDDNLQSTPIQNQAPETILQGVNVILSHMDSPSEFYLQLSTDLEAIEALQAELQLQIPNLTNLENPAPGILCGAPFSLDSQWYRAQVLDADDDITTVRFIDYGNTDVIDNKTTSIKTLPAEMLTTEHHARLCSLYVKPIGSEWSTSAIEKFEHFLEQRSLSAEIIHQEEKRTYVELYANNDNAAIYLKEGHLAEDLQLETETSSTGFISHLNSPSEFWMQLESSVPDLEWVAEQLANASNFPVLQDLTPGSLCAAIFTEDESWYRARILSNTVAGIEVIFVDYGNSFSCTELRELPEDLVMLPPLAMKCSLQKPTGILQWSSKAVEKFNEISADGATVFNVNILTTGETSIVQLTLDSEDVSFQLLPETQDCRISYFTTLDDIWIQLIENDAKLTEIENSLVDTESFPDVENPDVNDIIVTSYEDCWYRAKVVNKTDEGYNVLFIDYGNEAVVTDNMKKSDCQNVGAIAERFKLEILPRTKWADDSINKFHEINLDGTIFQLERVSENLARLYLNGEDIRTIIGTIKCSPLSSTQSSPKKMPSKESEGLNLEENEETVVRLTEISNDVEEPLLKCKESVEATEISKLEEIEVQSFIETGDETQILKSDEMRPPSPSTSIDSSDVQNELTELNSAEGSNQTDIAQNEDQIVTLVEILQKSTSIEDFGKIDHNETISDTSQPELDEETETTSSPNTSKDSNTSFKFIEKITSDICDKITELKSNEVGENDSVKLINVEVPSGKLEKQEDKGANTRECTATGDSNINTEIKAIDVKITKTEPDESVADENQPLTELSDNTVHSQQNNPKN